VPTRRVTSAALNTGSTVVPTRLARANRPSTSPARAPSSSLAPRLLAGLVVLASIGSAAFGGVLLSIAVVLYLRRSRPRYFP
jgi:hypothetical protein